jgi:hypothetical protein
VFISLVAFDCFVSDRLPIRRSAAELYKELQDAKTSLAFWKSLSTPQLLAFDYKMFPMDVNHPSLAPAICREGRSGVVNVATCAVLFPLAGASVCPPCLLVFVTVIVSVLIFTREDFLSSDADVLARMHEFCETRDADVTGGLAAPLQLSVMGVHAFFRCVSVAVGPYVVSSAW